LRIFPSVRFFGRDVISLDLSSRFQPPASFDSLCVNVFLLFSFCSCNLLFLDSALRQPARVS